MERTLRIAFVHPDLGIGGAERLVIDAAAGLLQAGHRVTIFATHRDPKRCFEETRDGSLDVRICGDFIPFQIGQHLRAPLAIARMCYVAARLGLARERFDVIFVDIVAQSIPLLRRLTAARVIFYCHFPDRLLAPRRGRLYRWYRAPIDQSEATAVGKADLLLVNSRFTASAAAGAYPRVDPSRIRIVYPGVDVSCEAHTARGAGSGIVVLCVNRFERRKNVALAIEALALLRGGQVAAGARAEVKLVIAGGFDERLRESRDVLRELTDLARHRDVEDRVRFVRNPSDSDVRELLTQCRCLLYTATDEHFGYVPVEAMAAGRPVIAANSGGPCETVVDGVTGFLRRPDSRDFAAALADLVRDPGLADRMGRAAREHVVRHFSRTAFSARLESVIEDLIGGRIGV